MSEIQREEKSFAVFSCATYGIRALVRLLTVYQKKYELRTLDAIISRYAPDVENDTNAYAAHVSQKTGYAVDEPIDLTKPETMKAVVMAIIEHENGSNPYTYEIDDGITLGLK